MRHHATARLHYVTQWLHCAAKDDAKHLHVNIQCMKVAQNAIWCAEQPANTTVVLLAPCMADDAQVVSETWTQTVQPWVIELGLN